MSTHISRRSVLGGVLGGVAGLAGCLTTTDVGYEIWALDQGTDSIYIYEAFSEPNQEAVEFDQTGSIDLTDERGIQSDGPFTPHTVRFSSDHGYAAITCLDAGLTLLYRAGDRQLVTSIDTGPGTHFASFTPEDNVIVDVMDERKIVHIETNFTEREFAIGPKLVLDNTDVLSETDGGPLYHAHLPGGQSVHTLGPRFEDGGLITLDHEEFTVEQTHIDGDIPANGALHPTPDGEMYLTVGHPHDDPEESSEESGRGEYYVFDTDAGDVIQQSQTSGIDPGGLWLRPDGSEMWILNRETNNGVVVDPETDEVVEELSDIGPANAETPAERDAPEDVWFSPDGQFAFVTLRGPVPPASSPHPARGVTPGVAVLNTETRERFEVLEPDPIEEYDQSTIENAQAEDSENTTQLPDFHGLGVRPLKDFDGANAPPY
jgi:hypothetical protein